MQKQTVEQRYVEQQLMNHQIKPKQHVLQEVEPQQKQQLQKICNEIKHSLGQASQAVQQAKLENPTQYQLPIIEQRLTYAVQQLQKLQSASPEITSGLSQGTKQQLTQLNNQIHSASNTLQLIQQSLQPNS